MTNLKLNPFNSLLLKSLIFPVPKNTLLLVKALPYQTLRSAPPGTGLPPPIEKGAGNHNQLQGDPRTQSDLFRRALFKIGSSGF